MADTPAKSKSAAASPEEPVQIELRNPFFAAVLAWIIPGAGHFYQGRWAKGTLFSVCIIGTYMFGLVLGQGKVVHTGGTSDLVRGNTFGRMVQRWPIVAQAGVGLPAAAAVIQHFRVKSGNDPLFGGWFAPPRSTGELYKRFGTSTGADELAYWNEKLNVRYDIGMLYTMVAGLLNILAVYDALAGPVIAEDKKKDENDEDEKKKSKDNDASEKKET
jgi:hypothetical protein